MASALLGGLQDSKLLADSSYDARRRVAKFKIAGGGAMGEFFPDLRIWLQVQLDKNLRISWEKARSGAVVLHFSGLSFAPLPGAQELYLKAGLDSFTCPSIKSVNQEEYYQCHLKKALPAANASACKQHFLCCLGGTRDGRILESQPGCLPV